MEQVTRRGLVTGLAAAGAAGAAGIASAMPKAISVQDIKKEGDSACLYHCDFADKARQMQMLNNINNHYSVYGANPFDIQLAVVAHAGGIRYFLDNWEGTQWAKDKFDIDVFERAASLAKNGLKIYLCELTFKNNKIDKAKTRNAEFLSFVPSGVATVAALQSKGFAYIKVQ